MYRAITTAIPAVVGFGFLILLDVTAAASLHTVWLVLWTLVGVVVSLGATQRRGVRLGLALVLLGTGIGLRRVDWDTRKPFLRDLDSIRPGMSAAEADAIMSRWISGTGWPANPLAHEPPGELQLQDARVYRHTDEGWGNSDWGIVAIKDGRVVHVSFSPD